MKKRDLTIDIMKGIGIIAVIIGHMECVPSMPYRKFIFSFHMPLFFILAGYFFKCNADFFGKMRKDFIRLIVPYIFTALLLLMYDVLHTYSLGGDVYGAFVGG